MKYGGARQRKRNDRKDHLSQFARIAHYKYVSHSLLLSECLGGAYFAMLVGQTLQFAEEVYPERVPVAQALCLCGFPSRASSTSLANRSLKRRARNLVLTY